MYACVVDGGIQTIVLPVCLKNRSVCSVFATGVVVFVAVVINTRTLLNHVSVFLARQIIECLCGCVTLLFVQFVLVFTRTCVPFVCLYQVLSSYNNYVSTLCLHQCV